jgi:protein-S-isoprenylcysteine O-methyltransferase Ste14
MILTGIGQTMNSSQPTMNGDLLVSAYAALIGFMALTGMVLLFFPKRRRVAWLLLCSVGVCLVGGAATYGWFPFFCPPPVAAPPARIPDGAGIVGSLVWIIVESVINSGPAIGWAIARLLYSILISMIGLLIGWFPLWLWFRLRRQRMVERT